MSAFGDIAVVTRELQGEGVIVAVAVSHRDKEREALARKVLGERYQRGQGIPGRVWKTERGILLVEVDSAAVANIAPPASGSYVREIGLQSMMLVPLREGERVVGTLGVAREPGSPSFTEEDFERLLAMAVLPPAMPAPAA
jgi:hypothetical protein